MFKKSLLVVSVAAALSLAGCGGGGGSSGGTTPPVVASSKIAGAAAKGIIKNGVVTAVELNANGSEKQQVGTALTDVNGAYELTLSSGYTGGALLIKLSAGAGSKMICDAIAGCNGTAYGVEMDLPANFGMNAISPPVAAGSVVKTQVTPFSHMAASAAVVEMANGVAPATAVNNAVTQINSIVGVDILDTQPVDITSPSAVTGATPEQQQYALFNAAFADVVATSGGDMSAVLNNYATEFADGDFEANPAVNLNDLIQAVDAQLSDPRNDDLNDEAVLDVSKTTDGLDLVVSDDGGYDPTPTDDSNKTEVELAKDLVQESRTWLTSFSDLETPAQAFAAEAEVAAKLLSTNSGAVLESSLAVVANVIENISARLKAGESITAGSTTFTTAMGDTVSVSRKIDPTVEITVSSEDLSGVKFSYTVTIDKSLSALVEGNGANQTITGKVAGTASNAGIAVTLDTTLTLALGAYNSEGDYTAINSLSLNGDIKLQGRNAGVSTGDELQGAVQLAFVGKNPSLAWGYSDDLGSRLSLSRFKLGDMVVKTASGSSAGFIADLKIDSAATFDALGFLDNQGKVWIDKCLSGDAAGFTTLANANGIVNLWDQHYSSQGFPWAGGKKTILNGMPADTNNPFIHLEIDTAPANAQSLINSSYLPLPANINAELIESSIHYYGYGGYYGGCDTNVNVLLDVETVETAESFLKGSLILSGKLALSGLPEATASVAFDRLAQNTSTASVLLSYGGRSLDIDVNRAGDADSGTLVVTSSNGAKLSVNVAAGSTSGTVKVGDVTVGTISNGILRYNDGTFESLN